MLNAGLVSVDAGQRWIGGLYYLFHLIRSVSAVPDRDVRLSDVWWQQAPAEDPFAEVRDLLAGPCVIAPPATFPARALRRLRRTLHRWPDARDLFIDAGIDVLFPITPCANPGIPFVFWIPDLQYRHLPDLFPDELQRWYDRHNDENGSLADLIAVSSETGRRDVERFLPWFAEKTRVLRFCSVPTGEWRALDPAAVANSYALPDKFFVLSNQFSHHKNHLVVFDAVRILRDRHGLPVTVVCTGSTYGFRGDDYLQRVDEFLERWSLRDAIRIVGLIPRSEQMALVRRSVAMLQPSRFEGWSTVVEDAKALGKPILLSDLEVHREQAPAPGAFLPLDDAEAWARAMAEAWERMPGPDLDEEARGARYSAQAMSETGRTFIRILEEAVARHD